MNESQQNTQINPVFYFLVSSVLGLVALFMPRPAASPTVVIREVPQPAETVPADSPAPGAPSGVEEAPPAKKPRLVQHSIPGCTACVYDERVEFPRFSKEYDISILKHSVESGGKLSPPSKYNRFPWYEFIDLDGRVREHRGSLSTLK